MRIRVWKKDGTSTDHPFTMDEVGASISMIDTIGMVYKKIAYYIEEIGEPCDIYAWVQEPTTRDPSVMYSFIHNAFGRSTHIPTDLFTSLVKNRFAIDIRTSGSHIDKIQATRLLFQQDIPFAHTPLGFYYTQGQFINYHPIDPIQMTPSQIHQVRGSQVVSTHAMLLKTFDIMEDTINVIQKKDVDAKYHDTYFPPSSLGKLSKADESLLLNLATIEEELDAIDVTSYGIQSNVYVNFIQLKGNDIGFQKMHSLEKVFNMFVTSDVVPFVKLKTASNVFYKVHKTSLTTLQEDDIMKKWVKTPKNKDTTTSLVCKVRYADSIFATFVLYTDLTFTCKLTISPRLRDTIDVIERFFIQHMNSLLESIHRCDTSGPTHNIEYVGCEKEENHILKICNIY